MILNPYRFGSAPLLPVWNGTPSPPDATDGDPYSYNVSSLVDNGPTSYTLLGTWPAGFVISNLGVITGTPSGVATYTGLTIRATNGAGSANSASFTLDVVAAVIVPDVARWSVHEIALTAASSYTNEYTDVVVTATYTHATHPDIVVKGFWDGGSIWRIRFAPPVTGAWNYSITNDQSDTGLSASGSINGITATTSGFVRVSGRGFVFDDGSDYYLNGMTGYEINSNAGAGTDWKTAIDYFATKNINKVRCLLYPFNSANVLYGDFQPFNGPVATADHDDLKIAFWQKYDEVIAYLDSKSIVIDIIIFSNDERAYGTTAQDERFTRYAIARFAAYTNVMWCAVNEYQNSDGGSKALSYWDNIGGILKSDDPWQSDNGSSRERPLAIHGTNDVDYNNDFADSAWTSYVIAEDNLTYLLTASDTPDAFAQTITVNNYRSGKPLVNDEFGYQGGKKRLISGTPEYTRSDSRRSMWAVSMAGAYMTAGDSYDQSGNNELAAAAETLNWRSCNRYARSFYDDVSRLKDFWTTKGLTFPSMVPNNALVTAGTRVYGTEIAGSQYVFYAAVGGAFTVTLAAGSYTATRYDPATGTETSLGSVSGGSNNFTMPNSNDWIVYIK